MTERPARPGSVPRADRPHDDAGRRASWTVRPGLTLVELMVAALMLAVLAAVAVPAYQKAILRARAARIATDFSAIRTAAYKVSVESNQWPGDEPEGVLPPALQDEMEGVSFQGDGYNLDWENWTTSHGAVIGITVHPTVPGLEAALQEVLGADGGNFTRLNNRYTFFIESPYAYTAGAGTP